MYIDQKKTTRASDLIKRLSQGKRVQQCEYHQAGVSPISSRCRSGTRPTPAAGAASCGRYYCHQKQNRHVFPSEKPHRGQGTRDTIKVRSTFEPKRFWLRAGILNQGTTPDLSEHRLCFTIVFDGHRIFHSAALKFTRYIYIAKKNWFWGEV